MVMAVGPTESKYPLHEPIRGQRWLIHLMRYAYSYKDVTQEGACFGIAHMAMQAMLLGEKEVVRFNQRLKLLKDILHEVSSEIPDFEKNKKAFTEAFEKKLRKLNPSSDTEFRAFFDGIMLYQSPKKFSDLFEVGTAPKTQDAMKTSPLTLSSGLEKKGGISQVGSFFGAYKLEELEKLFERLQKAVVGKNYPISLILGGSGHAISIGYDPKGDPPWFFADANQLPIQRFRQDQISELSRKVLNAMAGRLLGVSVFSTTVYVAGEKKEDSRSIMTKWQGQGDFCKIHKITPEKAQLVDDRYTSWLYIAAREGRLDVVLALLGKGADPNLARTGGETPLYIAAQDGRPDIVLALLKKGANPNGVFKNGATPTPLYIAAQNGHLDVVLALLEKGANPNLAYTTETVTPLRIAAQQGHHKVVRALLKAGAGIGADFTKYDPDSLEIVFDVASKSKLPLVVAKFPAGTVPPEGLITTPEQFNQAVKKDNYTLKELFTFRGQVNKLLESPVEKTDVSAGAVVDDGQRVVLGEIGGVLTGGIQSKAVAALSDLLVQVNRILESPATRVRTAAMAITIGFVQLLNSATAEQVAAASSKGGVPIVQPVAGDTPTPAPSPQRLGTTVGGR